MEEQIKELLAGPTPREEIKFRQADYKKPPGSDVQMLSYIDARYVMDRLDAIMGSENWWTEYFCIREIMFCKLTLRFPDDKIVSKMDCGSESEFEPEKAVVSDALKRAAVLFGIGRDLYSMPKFWAEVPASGYVKKGWKPDTWDKNGQSSPLHTPQPKPTPNPTPTTSASQVGPDSSDSKKDIVKYAEDVAQRSMEHRSVPDPVYEEPKQPTRNAVPPAPAPIKEADMVMAVPGMEIYHITEKSYLIGPPGLPPRDPKGKMWAAKKLVMNEDKLTFATGEIQTFQLPKWIVEQNSAILTEKAPPPPSEEDEVPF